MRFTVDSLALDVRYARRRLAGAPMFTAIAVVVLAMGIGVNTAFFSVVNGAIFKPLNVPNLNRLVNVAASRNGEVNTNMGLNERRFERLMERKPRLVGDLFTVHNFQAALEIGDAASVLMGEAVSGNYFSALGLRPVAGRLLVPADDLAGANGPAVLGARLWKRDFGGDPSVIGHVVGVSGLRLTIMGIAPEGFTGMTAPNLLAADLWAPQNSLRPLLETGLPGSRGGLMFRVFGRLSDGATISRADSEMRALGAGIDPDDPEVGLAVVAAARGLLPTQLVALQALIGTVLVALSSVVLFIACANLSGLVLARASSRATEVAVRMALGAGRRRIFQMQMVETSLLATVAGLVGLAMAWGLTRFAGLVRIPEIGGLVATLRAAPDLRVFFFALLAACAAAMLVGWAPAARVADTDPLRAWLTSGGSGGVTLRMKASTTRLVAVQLGASVSLLLLASLFVRSAGAAARYDAGIDMTHLAAGHLNLRMQNIKDTAGPAVFDRLLSGREAPGVRHVALASGVPVAGDGTPEAVLVEGQPVRFVTRSLIVSPGFFKTLDLHLVSGREFSEEDTPGQPNVVIVNEIAAADLWPGKNPIGRSLRMSSVRQSPGFTVVGVVGETDRTARDRRDRRYVFLPLRQNYKPMMTLLVAGDGDAASLTSSLKAQVASTAPEVAVFDVKPLAALLGLAATGARFAAATIGAMGLLGFLIAIVGLYGTVAYVVGERTREFGIMRALGADAGHIRRLVLRDATRMLMLGMAPGFVITFLLAGFLKSWLLGLPPHDPVTFIVVPLVMFLVGWGASLVPAHRASKTDPTNAIRHL